MVTSKETRVAIIALHQNGLTCKEIATKNIAPERTIYWIIKNFKERGSTAVKKSSGRPRVSSKLQDRLLLRSQLQNRVSTRAELAQECQQVGVRASARTVRPRLLDNGLVSRRAAKKPLLSPRKTSKTDWNSAGSTRIVQQKTGAKLFSLMKLPSNCLGHLEKEEKVNATMSPVMCQQ